MNRVTKAKKDAKANLIARREESAPTRSQAGTAELLADNATLMRLWGLEVPKKRLRVLGVPKKVACEGKRNVVLADLPRPDVVTQIESFTEVLDVGRTACWHSARTRPLIPSGSWLRHCHAELGPLVRALSRK